MVQSTEIIRKYNMIVREKRWKYVNRYSGIIVDIYNFIFHVAKLYFRYILF